MAQTAQTKNGPKNNAGPSAKTGPKAETKPSPALQAVDVTVGAVPTVADTVRNTVDTWRDSQSRSKEIDALQDRLNGLRNKTRRSTEVERLRELVTAELEKAEKRGGEVRREVTDQVVERARKARGRVEPVYRKRVEPVYRERVEPTVKRVRELV